MNIIFLDVDGVLNLSAYFSDLRRLFRRSGHEV